MMAFSMSHLGVIWVLNYFFFMNTILILVCILWVLWPLISSSSSDAVLMVGSHIPMRSLCIITVLLIVSRCDGCYSWLSYWVHFSHISQYIVLKCIVIKISFYFLDCNIVHPWTLFVDYPMMCLGVDECDEIWRTCSHRCQTCSLFMDTSRSRAKLRLNTCIMSFLLYVYIWGVVILIGYWVIVVRI